MFISTNVNRECLQTLTRDKYPELANLLCTVQPYLLKDLWVFACDSQEDAEKLYVYLSKAKTTLANILNFDCQITYNKKILYTINSVCSDGMRLQLGSVQYKKKRNMLTAQEIHNSDLISANEPEAIYTLGQIIEGLAIATKSNPSDVQKELMAMPINEHTVNNLTAQFITSKMQEAINGNGSSHIHEVVVESQAEPATAPTPTAESPNLQTTDPEPEPEPEEIVPKEILKKAGLPSQLGKLRSLTPLPPRSRESKVEVTEVKMLIETGLNSLNPKTDKHPYILSHMKRFFEGEENTESATIGRIYFNAFVEVYDRVDNTPALKRKRPEKIAAAVNALLTEKYPESQEKSEAA